MLPEDEGDLARKAEINNIYNLYDNNIFCVYAHLGVVVNTGIKPLAVGKSANFTCIHVIDTRL